MQTPDSSSSASMSDHFYTTDPSDFTASGYRFEDITGYLYRDKFANTIALHHWYNPTAYDNFYAEDLPEEPSDNGYNYLGIVGYIYRDPVRGTVPLLRWYHDDLVNHFYTTDSKGEIAPAIGYKFEGITGYLYRNPVEGTIPLFRWFRI
ncbi:hypothetical protein EDD21DRAFT_371887 [Dissophora ornata]|nr:hypothetical protein EDD21DRAFT_371887 [Dissophora ornata]